MPLTPADVGSRVVVRRRLPDGGATDVVGELRSYGDGRVVVRRAGADEAVAAADVIAARVVPPGPARIRVASVDDAEGIERLELRGWRTAYRGMVPDRYLDALSPNVERRRALLADAGIVELVADAAGCVVGWAGFGPGRDDDVDRAAVGEVYACYVDPDWWRFGIGRRLLRRGLDTLRAQRYRTATLWVLEANTAARAFYAAAGFAPDGGRQLLDLGGPVPEVRYRREL